MAFVTVSGRVNRVFFNGRGAEVIESFQVKGQTVQKRWTAWFEEAPNLSEGTDVELTGLHSDELNSWEKDGETKYSVKRSLNKARVKSSSDRPPVEPSVEVPPAWPSADVPF